MANRPIGGGSAFGGAPRYRGRETTGAGTRTNPYRVSSRRGQDDTRTYQERRAAATRARNQALLAAAQERDAGGGDGSAQEYVVTVEGKSIRASPGFARLAQERYEQQPFTASRLRAPDEQLSSDLSYSRFVAFSELTGGRRMISRAALSDPYIAGRYSRRPVSGPPVAGIDPNRTRGAYDPWTPQPFIRPVRSYTPSPGRAIGVSRVTGYVDTRTGRPAVLRPGRASGYSGFVLNTRSRLYNPDRGAAFDRALSRGGTVGEFAAGVVEPFRVDPVRGAALLGGSYLIGRGAVAPVAESVRVRGGAVLARSSVGRAGLSGAGFVAREYAATSIFTIPAVTAVYPRQVGRAAPFAISFGAGFSRGFEDRLSARIYAPEFTGNRLVDRRAVFAPDRQAGYFVASDTGRGSQTQLVLTTPSSTPVRGVFGGRALVGGGASPDSLRLSAPGVIDANRLPGATLDPGRLSLTSRGTLEAQSTLRPLLGASRTASVAGRQVRLVGWGRQGSLTFGQAPRAIALPSAPRGRFVPDSLFKVARPSFGASRVTPVTGRGFAFVPGAVFGLGVSGATSLGSFSAQLPLSAGALGLSPVSRQSFMGGRLPGQAAIPRSIATPISGQSTASQGRTSSILVFPPINRPPGGSGGVTIPVQPRPTLPPPAPPLAFPIFPAFGAPNTGAPGRRVSRRQFSYATSISALFTGATSSQQQATLTGGEIRPVVRSRRRSKRR